MLFALFMGRVCVLSAQRSTKTLKALDSLPDQMKSILQNHQKIREITAKYARSQNFFFLRRHLNSLSPSKESQT
ncbi:MAG: hypothetical protein M2R45_04014 [Verrucomicrobia subdivision 3 bacterium]|nr:hypothetical protein [Limisphaerales bacterium]MCS1416235.1 hypothetical protein [Limisphaerales bacterium]